VEAERLTKEWDAHAAAAVQIDGAALAPLLVHGGDRCPHMLYATGGGLSGSTPCDDCVEAATIVGSAMNHHRTRAEQAEREAKRLDVLLVEACARQGELAGDAIAAEASLASARDLLLSCWGQFAIDATGYGAKPGMRHDGGMSLLWDVAEHLKAAGLLVDAGVEGKDWYTLSPPRPRRRSPPQEGDDR
jgi:hypothetical protein